MENFSEKIESPQSPSEITVEWLRSMLGHESFGGKIISFEVDKNFGPWSLLGKAIRVKLDYGEMQLEPKSVIVKFQVSTSKPEREAEVYKLLAEGKFNPIPHLYGTFGNGNLILEDLTLTHSTPKEELTITQIQNVVSSLADLQNRFFGSSHIPKYDISHFVNAVPIHMESWNIFKERYHEQLGNDAATFEWISKNPEVISSLYNSDPSALSHGDVNSSNLLFPNDGSDKPIFIDWQLSAQRVIPFDLSYFIMKQLTVEQRREHEEALLKEYYELLSDEIKAKYSFDRLVLDYRACLTRSMLSAVMRVGARFSGQPNQFELADKLANRVIEAVKDLKPIEAIQELKMQ